MGSLTSPRDAYSTAILSRGLLNFPWITDCSTATTSSTSTSNIDIVGFIELVWGLRGLKYFTSENFQFLIAGAGFINRQKVILVFIFTDKS